MFIPPPSNFFEGNHKDILAEADYTDVRQYRYYDKKTRGLDYEGLLEDLKVWLKHLVPLQCTTHAIECS